VLSCAVWPAARGSLSLLILLPLSLAVLSSQTCFVSSIDTSSSPSGRPHPSAFPLSSVQRLPQMFGHLTLPHHEEDPDLKLTFRPSSSQSLRIQSTIRFFLRTKAVPISGANSSMKHTEAQNLARTSLHFGHTAGLASGLDLFASPDAASDNLSHVYLAFFATYHQECLWAFAYTIRHISPSIIT